MTRFVRSYVWTDGTDDSRHQTRLPNANIKNVSDKLAYYMREFRIDVFGVKYLNLL